MLLFSRQVRALRFEHGFQSDVGRLHVALQNGMTGTIEEDRISHTWRQWQVRVLLWRCCCGAVVVALLLFRPGGDLPGQAATRASDYGQRDRRVVVVTCCCGDVLSW